MNKSFLNHITEKKPLLFLLILLATSVTLNRVMASSLMPTISISPHEPSDDGTLVVDVMISDVTNLAGYEFKLKYDQHALTVTKVTITNDHEFFYDHYLFLEDIHESEGYLWLVVTLPLGTTEGVTGSGTVATIEFICNSPGDTSLELYDSKLGTPEIKPIEHTTFNAHIYLPYAWQGENVPAGPSRVFTVALDEASFDVLVYSNSSLTAFDFSRSWNKLDFEVEGETGTSGYFDIAVPKGLTQGTLMVLIDNAPVDYSLTENATHYFLYFTYGHSSHRVSIVATVNHFPYALGFVMAVSLVIGSLAVALSRLKRRYP